MVVKADRRAGRVPEPRRPRRPRVVVVRDPERSRAPMPYSWSRLGPSVSTWPHGTRLDADQVVLAVEDLPRQVWRAYTAQVQARCMRCGDVIEPGQRAYKPVQSAVKAWKRLDEICVEVLEKEEAPG